MCNTTSSGVYIGRGDEKIDDCYLKILNEIIGYVDGKSLPPIYLYDDLDTIQYRDDKYGITRLGCHSGQRKLLMTEIQFLTTCARDSNIIIYAGSAPCEHLPVLLEMFPKKKFLLIDPNYHNIDAYQIYVYQNVGAINSQNTKMMLKDRVKSKRRRMLTINKNMRNMNFYKSSTIRDVLYPQKNADVMKSIQSAFENTNYESLISDMIFGKNRIYVIQDYLTRNLSELIAKSMKKANTQICYISDIRTNMLMNHPTDLDYIWNDTLQLIHINILKPIYSMIKFHPPYFANDGSIAMYEDNNMNKSIYTMIDDDLNYAKSEHKLDTVSNYKNKQYMYFSNQCIYLQSWAPRGSSETRIIISRDDISKPYILYDHAKWENRFTYFNFIRGYAFFGAFYNSIKHMKNYLATVYDGCFDCMLDMMIITNYTSPNKEPVYFNIPHLINQLKRRDVQQKLEKINKKIDSVLLYNKSQKCNIHGHVTRPLVGIYFYKNKVIDQNTIHVYKQHIVNGQLHEKHIYTYNKTTRKLQHVQKLPIEIARNIPPLAITDRYVFENQLRKL